MAEITTATIMELRALTNAGMMDCKRALIEANGDMEEAIKQLRLKGQAIQVKRASKEANQGLVEAVSSEDGSVTALVEVNCETDFVAKTDKFKAFVKLVAERVLAGDDNEKVAESLKDELADLLATTGENVKIGRLARFAAEGTGKIGSYIHMGGKVGVVVEVGCGKAETLNCEAYTTLVHDLSLQIAAVSPRWLDDSQIPGDIITAERELYRQQMAEDKKPANVIDKIIEGKLRKFYSEVCLLDQPFVKEAKQSIRQLVAETAKACDDTITIRRFARFQVGAA